MLVVTVGAVQQELHNTFSKSTDCVRKSIRDRENWITNVWIVLVIFFRTKNLGKNISLPKTKFVLKNLIFHDGGPCYIGQLFHDVGPCYIETNPLIYSANQWTSFYMKGASVMKELNSQKTLCCQSFGQF